MSELMPKKIIVLDRDGVINIDSKHYIKSPSEWTAEPGSLQAIAALNKVGFTVVVATNQSGVARGLFNAAMLDRIHQKMLTEVEAVGGHIDMIFVCPHGPDDDCACRKPKAGLLEQVQAHYQVPFSEMLMVGDSLRDLQAAEAVGMPAMLVKTGKGELTLRALENTASVSVYQNLAHVALSLLRGS